MLVLPGLESAVTDFEGHVVMTIRSASFQHQESFIAEQLQSAKDWQQYIVKL